MIIIPARLKSNRFPNKVLADIDGLPMVVRTAFRVKELDSVLIATDSIDVINVAKSYGLEAILTDENHNSGTDRINEAANRLNLKPNEVIVNVQADEPYIEVNVVQKVIDRVKKSIVENEDVMIVSCYKNIDTKFATDPNHVKVIVDYKGDAIYFSRSKIPYDREEFHGYFGHLGIYGFTKERLNQFCNLKPAPIEDIEKLEQLRAIYWGKKIAMVHVESKSFGIDTIEDLQRAMSEFTMR